jgi:hypothetical protein|tara:strand:+ start:754 stop:1407 length:654 start_codon:yes stop_codon:yes gene_type:complete
MNFILDIYDSERSVEIPFICSAIIAHCKKDGVILDVGGVPTNDEFNDPIKSTIEFGCYDYRVADFRGGEYQGEFIEYDFKDEKFDTVMFLSSLEHFPMCTEDTRHGGMAELSPNWHYKEGEDIRGYQKALSILKDKGKIILTVPFGKPVWQDYHQNYNWEKLLELTKGSTIIEKQTFTLKDTSKPFHWEQTEPEDMEDIIYDDRAHGVGCFVMQKND